MIPSKPQSTGRARSRERIPTHEPRHIGDVVQDFLTSVNPPGRARSSTRAAHRLHGAQAGPHRRP